jgi:hypothetical protein
MEEDLAYLDALEAGETRLPKDRDTPVQRQAHERNVAATA